MRWRRWFPYLTLILWLIPLLFWRGGEQSFLPYDEGLYVWRARGMLLSGDWLVPRSWDTVHYHKPPGFYWLLAGLFHLGGLSEWVARLPAMLASMATTLFLFDLGKRLISAPAAWWGALLLNLHFVWFSYSRQATPDILTVLLGVVGVWGLLRAEEVPHRANLWRFGAGAALGLGVLFRSVMGMIPLLALLPYLWIERKRHGHLGNLWLWLGVVAGVAPTLIWLALVMLKDGWEPLRALAGFVGRAVVRTRQGNGWFYYLWNVPVQGFPWPLLVVAGVMGTPKARRSLLLGYPLVVLVGLSFISTRLPHYSLMLLPWLSLVAGVGLTRIGEMFAGRLKPRWLARNWAYGLGLVGGALVLLTTLFAPMLDERVPEATLYRWPALALGICWVLLPLCWLCRYRWRQTWPGLRVWLGLSVAGPWLALTLLGGMGLVGNYRPDVQPFLQETPLAEILARSPINFVRQGTGDEAQILLSIYTPNLGQWVPNPAALPLGSWAWVQPDFTLKPRSRYRVVGVYEGWRLVQVRGE
ncbi:glycosyl transferase family protein [Gloeomargarita lithophora Alchichica-D10]|uniref:Glycosyl transferase family protein n=1 Tax=Gloeomargarita lithophora Alchichica-D10 TaxID=1188229 RepID=A0A1J0AE38_9CYAN|nr:glycosyltransferase family 39 protein [Gloeomargarita lithophora]APB34184.1 glycosyl transferase family protein [Gloeomargarita lithophora Alchichica-D10]